MLATTDAWQSIYLARSEHTDPIAQFERFRRRRLPDMFDCMRNQLQPVTLPEVSLPDKLRFELYLSRAEHTVCASSFTETVYGYPGLDNYGHVSDLEHGKGIQTMHFALHQVGIALALELFERELQLQARIEGNDKGVDAQMIRDLFESI